MERKSAVEAAPAAKTGMAKAEVDAYISKVKAEVDAIAKARVESELAGEAEDESPPKTAGLTKAEVDAYISKVKAEVDAIAKARVPEPVEEPKPKERTLEDDLPQLSLESELTKEVERENQAKGEQSERVKEMQERLQKTMELKEQVETMFTLELQGLSEKLSAEAANEQTRAEEIVELKAKFSSALIAKKDSLEKDETLLSQMQSTQGLLREAAIKDTMDQAIADKETLCSIERVLVGKIEDCMAQLDKELEESTTRATKMIDVKSQLPALDDLDAVRSYSWEDIDALKTTLMDMAESSLKREAAIETIKMDFADALQKRRKVLNMPDPVVAKPPAASLPSGSAAASAPTPAAAASVDTTVEVSKKPNMGMTNDELVAEMLSAGADTGAALSKLSSATINAVASFLGQDEVQQTVTSLGKSVGAVGGVVGGVAGAVSNFNKEWEKTNQEFISGQFKKEGDAAEGAKEWWVKVALDKALSADSVKGSLEASKSASSEVVESIKDASKYASVALQKTSGTDSKVDPEALPSAVEEALDALSRTATTLSAIFGKAFGISNQNILPPSKK